MNQKEKKIIIYETEKKKELGDLFGLFFEDLNHAADGGLYAELVQNRSFEYDKIDNKEYHALTAWEKSPKLRWEVRMSAPIHAENPHYLHVEGRENDFILNCGYNSGIFVEKKKQYDFSVWARCPEGEKLTLEIAVVQPEQTDADSTDASYDICAAGYLTLEGSSWKKYELELTAEETTDRGRLRICLESCGSCDMDMVSLFPKDTFLGRKNGLRKDIAQALCDMKPKFMRFPGGCLTHTGSLDKNARDSMYRWENTIGPVEERPTRRNNWGYNQTLGLGYYEYFLFCEDIGAKPLPVLPGGFNPHTGEGAPLSEIGEWVQEALDLIEFANGSPDTKWGKVRTQLGHREPFGLEYLAIGNEEIGDGFYERYPYFHRAIREKYPEIKIINSAGPFSTGEGYEAGWTSAKKYGSDLIDEHYYCAPEWYLANMHHYEDYDEKGPKVFLGEYASWGNSYYNALVEAAYMTHLERSKAVGLACYAPMLCNIDYVSWRPNMLWFDNHRILKTPNYYVQKLFMEYQGMEEVAVSMEGLEEVIPLVEREKLDGSLVIQGNDVNGRLWDIVYFESPECENKTGLSEFTVTTDNEEHILHHADSNHYGVEFSFQRNAGRKGLKITFAKKDENNYLRWEFGGWDNWDCNVISVINGKSSVISHRILNVDDREYHLKLDVDGKHIRTWINGELFNDVIYRLPELEELYVTASKDTEGNRLILKAVNLTGDDKTVQIQWEGTPKRQMKAISLKGHRLTEENTFEEPDNIVPVEEQTEIHENHGNKINYTFGAHSFTVLVMEENAPKI